MIEMLSDYKIDSNSTWQRVLSIISAARKESVTLYVTLTDVKPLRSLRQNRLMHKWFKDIDNCTHQGFEYEAGRCKIAYFLPIMREYANTVSAKKSEQKRIDKCKAQIELFEMIFREKGYEYLCRALGESRIESTRLLDVKHFAQALTNMQLGEAEYPLTEPEMYGLDENL